MTIPDWTEAHNNATHWDEIADCLCDAGGWWHKNQYAPVSNVAWGTDRYTPRPVEPTTTAWNGTGQPPVGTECEAEDVDHGWILAIVMAHDNIDDVAVCKTFYGYDGYSNFRPIRTQAQIERQELEDFIESAIAAGLKPKGIVNGIIEKGYRLVKE